MIVMSKNQVKANEYRDMAQAAADLALATGLHNVREKHERAAAVWTELALFEERKLDQSAIQRARTLVAPRSRPAPMNDDDKLAAIRRGDVGSYNLAAPQTEDAFVRADFQHVAAQALGIAHGRGYFVRSTADGAKIHGLLVTVPADRT